jgi:hypothetical protein
MMLQCRLLKEIIRPPLIHEEENLFWESKRNMELANLNVLPDQYLFISEFAYLIGLQLDKFML